MPHFWNLSGIHPDVVMVLLLMLMYDRFLRQIGGRSSHPMILGSPIVPHLFALLGDTHNFPFFARSELLRMLACAGTSLHLVRAICGPTTRWRITFMQMILRRVVTRILNNHAIASSLALSFSAISTYPLRSPVAYLCLSINPNLSPDCTIWEIMSLLSVLPSANAILRISTEGFTPSQQKIYNTVYFVDTVRDLIGNRVFIMVCKFFHKQKKSSSNPVRLSFAPARNLLPRRQYCEQFEKLRRTPDFSKFMECIRSLSVTFLQPCERKQPDFMVCWRVVEVFYASMTACNWNFMSRLLREDDKDSVLELLEEGCPDSEVDSPLSFSLSFPDNSANGSGLPFLLILRRAIHSLPSVRMPKELLKHLRKKKNRKFDEDAKSQFYRIMHILCYFINFLTSDSPHRDFISSCIVFLKSNQEATFRDLEIYLDLRKMDPSTVCDFYSILSDFCNFANPSMHCTEMTKRSFLCFFDLMRDVLSHERFMMKFSILLRQLMRKKNGESIHDLIDTFINRRISTPGRYQFLGQMNPFQFTRCSDCDAPLSQENYCPWFRYDGHDNGRCDECHERIIMESQLKMYEREEIEFFASGPRGWE